MKAFIDSLKSKTIPYKMFSNINQEIQTDRKYVDDN